MRLYEVATISESKSNPSSPAKKGMSTATTTDKNGAGIGVPSPVRAVMQYEEDEALALKLQRQYDDEHHAYELQEEIQLEDQFDDATRRVDEERTGRRMSRISA